MREKSGYVKGHEELLRLFQSHKKPYEMDLLGRKWMVLPGVFSPKYSRDAEYFWNLMPSFRGDDFLEIGTGTGIIAIQAALARAKRVVATDLNPEAAKNAIQNSKRHSARVDEYRYILYELIPRKRAQ